MKAKIEEVLSYMPSIDGGGYSVFINLLVFDFTSPIETTITDFLTEKLGEGAFSGYAFITSYKGSYVSGTACAVFCIHNVPLKTLTALKMMS